MADNKDALRGAYKLSPDNFKDALTQAAALLTGMKDGIPSVTFSDFEPAAWNNGRFGWTGKATVNVPKGDGTFESRVITVPVTHPLSKTGTAPLNVAMQKLADEREKIAPAVSVDRIAASADNAMALVGRLTPEEMAIFRKSLVDQMTADKVPASGK